MTQSNIDRSADILQAFADVFLPGDAAVQRAIDNFRADLFATMEEFDALDSLFHTLAFGSDGEA